MLTITVTLYSQYSDQAMPHVEQVQSVQMKLSGSKIVIVAIALRFFVVG